MADFCSLCGYADIDIVDIYDRIIRPDLKEKMKELVTDNLVIGVNVSGVCEGCGLVAFGINNKYDALGYYFGEPDLHKFGYVDEVTLNLIIDKDDPKYENKRRQAEYDYECMLRDIKILEDNKDWMSIQDEIHDMGFEPSATYSSGQVVCPIDRTYYGIVNDPENDKTIFISFPYGELNSCYEVDRSIPFTDKGLPTLKLKEGE